MSEKRVYILYITHMLVVFHFREAPAAAFCRNSKRGPAKVRSSWMILGLKVKLHSQVRGMAAKERGLEHDGQGPAVRDKHHLCGQIYSCKNS